MAGRDDRRRVLLGPALQNAQDPGRLDVGPLSGLDEVGLLRLSGELFLPGADRDLLRGLHRPRHVRAAAHRPHARRRGVRREPGRDALLARPVLPPRRECSGLFRRPSALQSEGHAPFLRQQAHLLGVRGLRPRPGRDRGRVHAPRLHLRDAGDFPEHPPPERPGPRRHGRAVRRQSVRPPRRP